MKKLLAAAAVSMLAAACSHEAEEPTLLGGEDTSLSFFVTSEPAPGGANLGGLEGADALCQRLASAVGAGGKTWRAYLSAEETPSSPKVNARDRIGSGPWYNVNGVRIASSVSELHSPSANLTKQTSLTEKGGMVNGVGDTPNQHDILTGSFEDGTLYVEKDARSATCENWTNGGQTSAVFARVGHVDRQGGGPAATSWNSSHNSRGCSLDILRSTGGDGRLYCFAAD